MIFESFFPESSTSFFYLLIYCDSHSLYSMLYSSFLLHIQLEQMLLFLVTQSSVFNLLSSFIIISFHQFFALTISYLLLQLLIILKCFPLILNIRVDNLFLITKKLIINHTEKPVINHIEKPVINHIGKLIINHIGKLIIYHTRKLIIYHSETSVCLVWNKILDYQFVYFYLDIVYELKYDNFIII